jgi:hypothetical protein
MLAGPVAVGEVVEPGDAGVRAERIFEIIRVVLAARATFTDLPHIRSFTTNLDDLPAYGTVRRKLLPAANPAGQHHRRSQSALPARRGAGGGGRGGGDPRPPMNLHNPFTRRARTAVMIWCVGSRIMVAVVVVDGGDPTVEREPQPIHRRRPRISTHPNRLIAVDPRREQVIASGGEQNGHGPISIAVSLHNQRRRPM